MNCTRCAHPAPDDARFCSNCGFALPRARAAEGERRVVTVLFCDLKGSTALAERFDPEDWATIIGRTFDALTAPIQRYEGTVARLMGDAILAYFGAPVAHEDDPERAILAALEMREAAAACATGLRAEYGIEELLIRVGINTGLAVVGEAGRAQAVEYTAMGDAVNVAARLQTLAEPGAILIGGSTWSHVVDRFEVRPLGAVDVKGRSASVTAYEVIGRRAAGSPEAALAPLVGRSAEVATLREVLADLRSGRGRIVAIVGEAGIGKKRLLSELREEWGPADWTEARGQSYGSTRPFLLFRQHLLSWCGIAEGSPPEAVLDGVRRALGAPAGDDRAVSAVAAVLGVDPVGSDLEGRALHDEIVAAVERVARKHFADRPSVAVFNDLHWSDPASVDLLVRLLGVADELPVALVFSFRPDRRSPAWRLKQVAEVEHVHLYTEVELQALSAAEGGDMLRGILDGATVPTELAARIFEKAEGNPFFVEELVRALRQEGALVRTGDEWRLARPLAEIQLPDSVHGLVVARIDRLDEGARSVLQAAAVVGRTFAYDVLRGVVGPDVAVDRHLSELQRADLVHESARRPERTYSFRHALAQEAAYSAILQRRRRELHRQVAETLVALYADRIEDYAGLIGRHFREAGDPRAVAHLRLAGERAMRLFALEDAIASYSDALLAVSTDAGEAETLIALYEGRGRARELRGDFDAAVTDHETLERLGAARGDLRMELTGLAHRITLLATPTPRRDLAEAERLNTRALPLAREAGERTVLARLLWNEVLIRSWRRHDEDAIAAGEEGARTARELGQRELLAYILNDVARPYRSLDRIAEARERLREAGEIFRELGNKPMLADNLSTTAYMCAYEGDFDGALAASSEARRLSIETDNPWGRAFSVFGLGFVYYERGDWGGAIEAWEDGLVDAKKAGFIAMLVGPRAELARIYRYSGDPIRAAEHLRAADDTAADRFADWRRWTLGHRALAAAEGGRLDEADELWRAALAAPETPQIPMGSALVRFAQIEVHLARGEYDAAISIARENGAEHGQSGGPLLTADWDWYEGEALWRSGRLDEAVAAFEEVIRRSGPLRSVSVVWRALASLARIADRRGRPDEAAALRARSREIVERIATSLERVGLRDAFLARPDVAEVLVPA